VVLTVWVLALLPLTWQQVGVWRNSVTLWSHAVALAPNNRQAHLNLASAHEATGHYAAAAAEYEEVVRLSNRLQGRSKAGLDGLALTASPIARALEPGFLQACEGVVRVARHLGVEPGLRPGCPRDSH